MQAGTLEEGKCGSTPNVWLWNFKIGMKKQTVLLRESKLPLSMKHVLKYEYQNEKSGNIEGKKWKGWLAKMGVENNKNIWELDFVCVCVFKKLLRHM